MARFRITGVLLAACLSGAIPPPQANNGAPALAPAGEEGVDPLAALTTQFRLQQEGAGAGAAKGSLPKWLEKPPWWLPTPPEWGPPPAHMYGSWYDPRNIPQVGFCVHAAGSTQFLTLYSIPPGSPSSEPTLVCGARVSTAAAARQRHPRPHRPSDGTVALSRHTCCQHTQARTLSSPRTTHARSSSRRGGGCEEDSITARTCMVQAAALAATPPLSPIHAMRRREHLMGGHTPLQRWHSWRKAARTEMRPTQPRQSPRLAEELRSRAVLLQTPRSLQQPTLCSDTAAGRAEPAGNAATIITAATMKGPVTSSNERL